MFVRSVTDTLEPCEAERLCEASSTGAEVDPAELSADGRAVYELLTASHREAAELALQRLSPSMRERLDVMSPLHYIDRVFAPMIIVGHDRDDLVIPVGESRRLVSAPRSPRRRDVHRVRDIPARRSDQTEAVSAASGPRGTQVLRLAVSDVPPQRDCAVRTSS